jgi:hypothetical protein
MFPFEVWRLFRFSRAAPRCCFLSRLSCLRGPRTLAGMHLRADGTPYLVVNSSWLGSPQSGQALYLDLFSFASQVPCSCIMDQPKGLIASSLEAYLVDPATMRILFAAVLLSGAFLIWLRRLKLSSMSKIPGPWYLKLTTLFVKYHEFSGDKALWIHNLHVQYGPVVQIARDQVSFASYTSSKQIYSTGNKDFWKTDLYDCFQQDGHMFATLSTSTLLFSNKAF